MEVNGVEFSEEAAERRVRSAAPFVESLSERLVRLKIAKTPQQANMVLLGVIGVCVIIMAASLYISARTPVGPTAADLARDGMLGKH